MCRSRNSGVPGCKARKGERNGRRIFVVGLAGRRDEADGTDGLKRGYRGLMVPAVMMFGLLVLTGCAGTSANGEWWEDMLRWDPNSFDRALHNAVWDLQTLVPAAGAAVFCTVDDFDQRVSRWAVEHNPIFGSEECARDTSDILKCVLGVEAIGTLAAATVVDDDPNSEAKRMVAEGLAWGATKGTTAALKCTINRTRPNGENRRSFPSGHTSEAFSFATLANRNLDYIGHKRKGLGKGLRRTLQVTNLVLVGGVAWGRVEGKKHYPSDVLAGAALGHFLTTLVHDYYVDVPEEAEADKFDFLIAGHKGGVVVQVAGSF